MSLIGAIQETPKGTLDASCQFKTSCGREGLWWSIMASLKRRRQKAADVLSRRIDTACRSRLTGCSQTFGRKPRFCLSTPAWFYNSLVFCWEEWELKLTCEGEKEKKPINLLSRFLLDKLKNTTPTHSLPSCFPRHESLTTTSSTLPLCEENRKVNHIHSVIFSQYGQLQFPMAETQRPEANDDTMVMFFYWIQ